MPYTYGTGVDEPLVRNSGSLKEYYHADILGSVVTLSDAHEVISTYGKKVNSGTASDYPYLFTPLPRAMPVDAHAGLREIDE